MPGPTALRLVLPADPRFSNARMIPITVPNNPINGETDAMVASQFRFCSSRDSCSLSPELQAARDRFVIGEAAARLHLAADFLIAVLENGDQRRGAKLLARHHHGFKTRGFTEGAQKAPIAFRADPNAESLEKMTVQE